MFSRYASRNLLPSVSILPYRLQYGLLDGGSNSGRSVTSECVDHIFQASLLTDLRIIAPFARLFAETNYEKTTGFSNGCNDFMCNPMLGQGQSL